MARPPKTLPRTVSKKDREFEELLRRAFEFLNSGQPSKALPYAKKKQNKVA